MEGHAVRVAGPTLAEVVGCSQVKQANKFFRQWKLILVTSVFLSKLLLFRSAEAPRES